MALFSLSFVSYTTSAAATHQLTQGWFSPSSNPSTHSQKNASFRALRPAAKGPPSFIHSPSRVSFAHENSAPTPPDDDPEEEDSSQQKERHELDVQNAHPVDVNLPSETRLDDSAEPVAYMATESSSSVPSNRVVDNTASSSSPSVVDERELQHQVQLRETLAALNQSLALLSATLKEVSSAVRIVSSALSAQILSPASASSPTPTTSSPSSSSSSTDEGPDKNDGKGSTQRNLVSPDPPEPWDDIYVTRGEEDRQDSESTANSYQSHVPPHLVEENRRAHKLAYKLQQSFIQARIQGLGKPFQVAAEDFTDACMDAHALGIGLKELQLQLILQDGSLTGAFAIRSQRWSDDPILNEESRIRSLWVRLIYATVAQLGTAGTEEAELDPVDAFVKQVVQAALENGHELERVKLEQVFAGQTVNSGAVKAMRENQYLILLALDKAKSRSK